MYYTSTRNSDLRVTSAEAIAQGISNDGGLFVPCEIPSLTQDEILGLCDKSYADRAFAIFSKFLTDFSDVEIRYCVDGAYNTKNFDTENIMELACLFDGIYMLELWHGPTCAFKDMALQILPYLLTTSVKKLGSDKKVVILVATSGDTGKAALEGFKDVENTEILVFYPVEGVSAMQKLQMVTQEGENVGVCAIQGNFDDAQTGVKKIFTDPDVSKKLADNSMMFSSANSINWGRLAPQIIYYVSTYVQLVADEQIRMGDKINVVVPTGNFGNILAAYYAKKMGVPINKLICASNSNNVLTDFINTGIYDRNRKFITTVSPSMDILISSNLERLLYHMSNDDKVVKKLFAELAETGKYQVPESIKAQLDDEFYAGYTTDDETLATIKAVYDKYSYTMDTHTAVAVKVYYDYVEKTGDTTKTVIASTASPYKFSSSVLKALDKYDSNMSEFELVDVLADASKMPIPSSLAALKSKTVRFDGSATKDEMLDYIYNVLEVK